MAERFQDRQAKLLDRPHLCLRERRGSRREHRPDRIPAGTLIACSRKRRLTPELPLRH